MPTVAAARLLKTCIQPFKMGLQSYSLRGLKSDGQPDRAKLLDATKELGIHHWEAFPAHVPMQDDLAVSPDFKAEACRPG